MNRRVGAYGGAFVPLEPGVWAVEGLEHRLYCVETAAAADRALRLFSPEFLQRPGALFSLLSEQERAMFMEVYNEVWQFRHDPQAPLRFADFEEFAMNSKEIFRQIMAKTPPEERMEGLPPEERVKGLAPEERLLGLSEEERERLLKLLLAQRDSRA